MKYAITNEFTVGHALPYEPDATILANSWREAATIFADGLIVSDEWVREDGTPHSFELSTVDGRWRGNWYIEEGE